MQVASLQNDVKFSKERPGVSILMESSFTKEIRIILSESQEMKKHKTSFPIVVEVYDGSVLFTVDEKETKLEKGSLICLEGGIPHSLLALENSIIRLTLFKQDNPNRVKEVANA